MAYSSGPDGQAAYPAGAVKTCTLMGCENAALWRIGMRIYPQGGGTPAQGWTGLYCCTPCKPKVTFESLMSDEGWQRVCDRFIEQGLVPPDRRRGDVTFMSLD